MPRKSIPSEPRPLGDLRTKIWMSLKELETPSAFAYSASSSSLPNPCLCLKRSGVVGLPLSAGEAQKIISQASQSPFGKGEDTIVDTSIRKSWELNPNQFTLQNPEWKKAVKSILDDVTVGLGIKKGSGRVSAKIHKLLLYEPGAFFKPHTDSEKMPGMFGTLVICLPSPHEGGKVILTHGDDKYEFETAKSSNMSISYAAWYADITHEVTPVTSGYRLMLTYNLSRQSGFEVPSYELICGRMQALSKLLKEYESRLEGGDNTLPPLLVHRFKHKYTEANFQLESLKPQDLAQVQTLTQLSTKLGFDIYLATLELKIEFDKENPGYYERKHRFKKIINMDSKLIAEKFAYPKGGLIDPTPQDAAKADDKYTTGHTGNEGCLVINWYRDAVAILVPPSKQAHFVFEFGFEGKVIEPLFCKLMQEFSKDPNKQPKLVQLCELALKQKPKERYYGYDVSKEPIPPYFQQAAAAVLDLGRIDLFDVACKSRGDKVMLDNARALGRWAAKEGVAAMRDRLTKGVQAASSIAEKLAFLESIAEGFATALQESSSAEDTMTEEYKLLRESSLKQWSDEVIFTAIAELKTVTKADAASMAQVCKTVDWNLFVSKVTPVILNAATMLKISFINELMANLQQERNKEQQSFIEMIIHKIWNAFVFNLKQEGSASSASREQKAAEDLNANDLRSIVENTLEILSPKSLETIVIPAMLNAVPNASKECSKDVFIPFIGMIIKNEVGCFRLPANDETPPMLHKSLVQSFLLKYLKENVGLEPEAPANWSLPPVERGWSGPCRCGDCRKVNQFLQDPVQKVLDIPCGKDRRRHLYEAFEDCMWHNYDCETIRNSNPCVWRITKNQCIYERNKAKWSENTEAAVQTLSDLKKEEPVNGRLESYLQPHYSSFMNANLKELPDLESLVATSQSSQTNKNGTPAHNVSAPPNQTVQIVQKRGTASLCATPQSSQTNINVTPAQNVSALPNQTAQKKAATFLGATPQSLQTSKTVAPAHSAAALTNQTVQIVQKRGTTFLDTTSKSLQTTKNVVPAHNVSMLPNQTEKRGGFLGAIPISWQMNKNVVLVHNVSMLPNQTVQKRGGFLGAISQSFQTNKNLASAHNAPAITNQTVQKKGTTFMGATSKSLQTNKTVVPAYNVSAQPNRTVLIVQKKGTKFLSATSESLQNNKTVVPAHNVSALPNQTVQIVQKREAASLSATPQSSQTTINVAPAHNVSAQPNQTVQIVQKKGTTFLGATSKSSQTNKTVVPAHNVSAQPNQTVQIVQKKGMATLLATPVSSQTNKNAAPAHNVSALPNQNVQIFQKSGVGSLVAVPQLSIPMKM
ncbi:unnamed protein product [Bemisia tabaci]|uniref:Prolyl 4-hydroxylase alpha subunit Fe(2+) 2OG dioxygenase domain-containing protein n=1 Tax=Bemisia tabaci TaxID=7038 RepID=A0A9P0AJC7_BEMTA|nr:unnamed protein product [Bemisia tabaci]